MDPARFQGLRWRCIGPHRGGRVVAVAGDSRPSRWCSTSAPWPAASGRPTTAARPGRTSPTASSRPPPSARSPSPSRTRTSSTPGRARRRSASTSPTATASTDRPTAARPGRTGAGRHPPHRQDPGPSREPGPRLRRRARPRLRAERASAASSARGTAARPGSRCSSRASEPARSISRSTRRNPRILYAAIWEAQRYSWTLSSGGAGQRLWQVDRRRRHLDGPHRQARAAGGHHWARSASPSRRRDPDRVWAIVEAEEGGAVPLGRRRRRPGSALSDNRDLRHRALVLHARLRRPEDPDTVYVLNLELWKSTDGGATFTEITDAARRQPRPVDRPRATPGA